MVYKMENPIKMDDLGLPLFSETLISFHCHSLVFGRGVRWDDGMEYDGHGLDLNIPTWRIIPVDVSGS